MNEDIYSDLAIEQACKTQFGLSVDIKEVVARMVSTGVASQATLFITANGQVYLYITSQSNLVLDDVNKIVQRMQCEAERILPPHGEDDYFDRIAREKFKAMFPGKHITGTEDLRYYRNLAPYNPALVRLAKVKGELRGFERESKTWRKVRDFTYNRIKTI